MGHEIIVYRDRHVVLGDHDLCLIRHFLLLEAEPSDGDLKEFVGSWQWIGPGVWVGNDWDEFFSGDPAREPSFDRLLARTAQRIQAFGPRLPLGYLQKHVNSPTFGFHADQPVDGFVKKIDEMRQLLATK